MNASTIAVFMAGAVLLSKDRHVKICLLQELQKRAGGFSATADWQAAGLFTGEAYE
jgi:hypothetical protein